MENNVSRKLRLSLALFKFAFDLKYRQLAHQFPARDPKEIRDMVLRLIDQGRR